MHRDNNYETTEYCIHHFAKQNILFTQTLLIKVANDETYLLILFLSV